MQCVAMPAGFCLVGVMVIVKDPSFEVGAVDHQCVPFPVTHRVAVVRRIQILAMGSPIQWNDSRHSFPSTNVYEEPQRHKERLHQKMLFAAFLCVLCVFVVPHIRSSNSKTQS